LHTHLVGPPPDSAAPEREKLVAWSRVDAERVAEGRGGLSFQDPGNQPSPDLVARATRILASTSSSRAFAALAPRVGEAMWDDDIEALGGMARDQSGAPNNVADAIGRGDALRAKCHHYLGAIFHYAGENYWGVDRLSHLERRLIHLGASRQVSAPLLAPRYDVSDERIDAGRLGLTLEVFVSLRSPYSYISMPRAFDLATRAGIAMKLRPVLPMVMRGLPVPASKRMYITLDTKREADAVGMPFGRICDPVGKPVERGFSLYPFAVSKGRAGDYLLSFCRAVFAEGIDAGTDEGLRHIVEAAGLSWNDAARNRDIDGWRPELEANREDMMAMGLWGVPSFRLSGAGASDFCVWGQDRIWMVEDEIRRRVDTAPS
jgi:2-hydroxychromene-2-carboxylate isomerase